MFGYVRGVKDLLSPEDAQRYEGVYCGLCHVLKERYGRRTQFILNFDFVFLAILLAQPEEACTFPTCSCPYKPWKKKACWPMNPALEAAADASVILTWWKLRDSIRDGDWKERTLSRSACLALKGPYERAAVLRPDFDTLVRDCLEELHRLEEANTPSLDRPADTFARILQGAATRLEPLWRASAVGQILYHVGRWIYLVDAWDDLPRDKLTGSYNPILARFGEEAQEQKDYIRNTLHDSLGVADTAFSLLDWGEWEGLLQNILGTGLHAVEEAVFTGQWKKKQKKPDHT
ncbi:MAG: hypothetical protein IKB65_04570 [Ruminiclostridium sp.]|nr:hypothetical protein [Ruminiclostridium sp.]